MSAAWSLETTPNWRERSLLRVCPNPAVEKRTADRVRMITGLKMRVMLTGEASSA
jgi:hypothetical protein